MKTFICIKDYVIHLCRRHVCLRENMYIQV